MPTVDRTCVLGSITPPDAPLTVNGQAVTPWRTGGFVCMIPVVPGTNLLTLKSGSTTSSQTFFVPYPNRPSARNAFSAQAPLQPLGVYTGETVRLVCIAPTGHAVFAAVGERTIAMCPDAAGSTRRSAAVSFAAPAEEVPVQFYADTLTNTVHAAPITVRAVWPTLRVVGGLFSTRVRTAPGDGETAGFLPPDLCLQGAGFIGPHTRVWLAGEQYFVESNDLALSSVPQPPRDLPLPDLAQGFGPHPPVGRTPTNVLVVLDPGHGADATGAVGPCGVTEKSVALKQAFVVKQTLETAGFHVRLTRESDVNPDLYARAQQAYAERADAFIALHYNATVPATDPRTVRHVSTYYWNDIGEGLAQALHAHVAAATAPVPDGGVRQASFAVCRNPAVPSVLIEMDFITDPEGEEAIQTPERQQRVAEAILAGLRDWLAAPAQ